MKGCKEKEFLLLRFEAMKFYLKVVKNQAIPKTKSAF